MSGVCGGTWGSSHVEIAGGSTCPTPPPPLPLVHAGDRSKRVWTKALRLLTAGYSRERAHQEEPSHSFQAIVACLAKKFLDSRLVEFLEYQELLISLKRLARELT